MYPDESGPAFSLFKFSQVSGSSLLFLSILPSSILYGLMKVF